MPSKDTISARITKKTAEEIERIRKVISKEMGIPLEQITKKNAEIALRIKAKRGKLLHIEIKNILLGKIR